VLKVRVPNAASVASCIKSQSGFSRDESFLLHTLLTTPTLRTAPHPLKTLPQQASLQSTTFASQHFQPSAPPRTQCTHDRLHINRRGLSTGEESGAGHPHPQITLEDLESILSDFVEALDEDQERFATLAMLPDTPAQCLQEKWTQTHLQMIPQRIQILSKYRFEATIEGHAGFTKQFHKLLRQHPEEVKRMPNAFEAAARIVFGLEDASPLADSVMDALMEDLVKELESERVLHDVQDLAAHATRANESQAITRTEFALLKVNATLRVIVKHQLKETDGWVRVMVASQTWPLTADRDLLKRFAATNQHLATVLSLV